MDDEDGRCLLDVICDPQALNDFLHGSETQLDTDDLLDGSSDPSSSFFSNAGEHVAEVQPQAQLSVSEPAGLPRVSVDLDFLEDDDILGGSPGGAGEGGSNGVGSNHEPCDILQQSLAEANITEQSLQEAEAELDLSSFGLTGLTQVVQPLPDATLPGVGIGGATQIFSGQGTTATPSNATADMLGSVLAHPGLQLQPQVMNKTISVQPFMQQVGLGNVTLQPISSLQALPNGSQSGPLGIGQIQVVGQPTVMTINSSGQQILAKPMGGYQLHQPGTEAAGAGTQAGLGGSVLSSSGGLLIQGAKTALGSPSINGPAVCVSSTNTNSSGTTMAAPSGIVGFSGAPLGTGIGSQTQAQPQSQIMQNVIIQRTPTPIQPKPPQGGAIQPKLFKPQQQQQLPSQHALQNDANKTAGVQQVSASAAQNVAFLTGKPGSNVVLSTQTTTQGAQFPQALFKPQGAPASGKPLSVHVLNQQGSIVIPSQAVLQGQNHQFLLPQIQAGGQILAQHPGGHIITSSGPGGQIIAANQILTANQNINLGQVLASQGHPGAAHILSAPIQLQPGQMGHPTLFQMPVSLAQTQNQAHPVTGHVQTVIQGMPIQNSLSIEGLSPAVSLQPALQQQAGGVPTNSSTGAATMAQCQPGESITVLGSATEQAAQPQPQPSILTVQTTPSVSTPVSTPASSSSSSSTVATATSSITAVGLGAPAQHSPGKVLFTPPGSSMILSQEPVQMFLQQEQQHPAAIHPPASVGVPASVIVSGGGGGGGSATAGHDKSLAETHPGRSPSPAPGPTHMAALVNKVPSATHQQTLKLQSPSPSQAVAAHSATATLSDSPQASQNSPLTLSQQIQSPHPLPQSRPPSQPSQPQPQPQSQSQTPSRACTPSSLPPLFIIHNQIGGSPQPAAQAPQKQTQVQAQQIQVQIPQVLPQPLAQPVVVQQEAPLPAASCSPKPSPAPPAQFQFATPAVSLPAGTVLKPQVTTVTVPVPGLTAEQQHHLQMVSAQLQTMSSIAQPSPQQKQLLEKLQQVQHTILLQAKQQAQAQAQAQAQTQNQTQVQVQAQAPGQFSKLAEQPAALVATTVSVSVPSLLQPKSVLVKSSTAGSNDTPVFSGVSGSAGVQVNQGVVPANLAQAVQAKPGVISTVGGLTLGKPGLQLQVLSGGLSHLPVAQPPAPVQTQTSALKRPFGMEPSKEARMLEQLRKHQGSVLHPDYSSPFRSFEDTLHRLLPYHLYQGTTPSPQDYRKVDDEFESVSSQLLKRTQAMLDKYRHLLFEESRRLGPSAEMVMIDRMFIQEEKMALSQDRILAKEKPEEFVANSCLLNRATESSGIPTAAEPSTVRTAPPAVPPLRIASPPAPAPVSVTAPPSTTALTPAPFPPTKLVIKQGGGGALVSWSTSCPPAPSPAVRGVAEPTGRSSERTTARPSSSSCDNTTTNDDEDALPQRTSKPPIKTYEARQRIGLKLKIKQEAGLSKVVHNTALDPIHSQSQHPPEPSIKTKPPVSLATTVIRTPPLTCNPASSSSFSSSSSSSSSSSTFTAAPSRPGSTSSGTTTSNVAPHPAPPHSSVPQSWSSSSSSQMNGTLEHHEVGGTKRNLTATSTSSSTSSSSSSTTQSTTCRLPLRKTYRENISPRHRPGVPGGGDVIAPIPAPAAPGPPSFSSSSSSSSSSPQPERTVIASMKLERQGACVSKPSDGDSASGLAAVEDEFYRGIKNAYHHHHQQHFSDKEEEDGDSAGAGERVGRLLGLTGKKRERAAVTFRMDQHAPGPPPLPPSPGEPSGPALAAKRCKSDSPDVDNASFSSGSPPPDDSLNEHLQCAIDSILNLQQGPAGRASLARVHSANLPNQHQTHHRQGMSLSSSSSFSSSSYGHSVSSSSSTPSPVPQHPQVGGRGQNGSLVSQSHSR